MIYDDVLFDFRSNQDYKNSEQVIAEVDQGGLSLPDRDFYLLQDSKTIKLRKAYVAHVRRVFDLLGDAPGLAEDESHAVMRIETALAKGSMSRVDRREPRNVYHKMSRAELEAGEHFIAGPYVQVWGGAVLIECHTGDAITILVVGDLVRALHLVRGK